MSVMTTKNLTASIRSIKSNRVKLQGIIQEALISCAYYAMKDGNTTPFNQLLDAVGNSIHVKGITMWAELFAPVHVKDKQFVLSKKRRDEHAVLNEDDFAPFEAEMRQAPWYEIAGKQRVESIWDCGDYLQNVAKTLRKHGVDSGIIAEIERVEMMARIAKTRAEDMDGSIDGDAVVVEDVPALRVAA